MSPTSSFALPRGIPSCPSADDGLLEEQPCQGHEVSSTRLTDGTGTRDDSEQPGTAPAFEERSSDYNAMLEEYRRITWLGNPCPVRGRTPERTEYTSSIAESGPGSRASSAGSAFSRSMIDERMERAHQDRVRFPSRDKLEPRAPFQEHSPYYEEYARDADDRMRSRSIHICECCPDDPQKFDTLPALEYALAKLRS